ncbi:MAG: hypothetical protein ABI395_00205 [Sphingobium sp.]
MWKRYALIPLVLLATTACAAAASNKPQTASTASKPAQPVKTASTTAERPDFSGIWDRFPDPYEGGLDYPAPPGGPPPLLEPYLSQYNATIKKRDETLKRGELVDDPSTRCLPEGMPTIMGGIYAIEFVQSPKQVVVLAEFLTQTRRIYIDEAMPPVDEIFPSYNGYSVAHWEGDTLAVETRGVRDSVPFLSMPHSADMVLTERIRLTAPDRLEDQITITDPKVFAKPYTFIFGYQRLEKYKIQENICDNNRYTLNKAGEPVLDTDTQKSSGSN